MRAITFALLLPLAACGNDWNSDDTLGIQGTGTGGTRSYAVADFSTIEARGPDTVDVRVGAGFSVRAEGDEDEIAKLKIEKVGDGLRIGRRRSGGISWGGGDGIRVFVTMPRLTAASLAGSGDLAVDRVEGGSFTGSIAGSGDLKLGALAVEQVKLSIAGSGDLSAAGTARRAEITIAGSGDIRAADLTAQDASVSIAGSGNVRARVTGAAEVKVMGSGDVELTGGGRCTSRTMGSGEVRCGS